VATWLTTIMPAAIPTIERVIQPSVVSGRVTATDAALLRCRPRPKSGRRELRALLSELRGLHQLAAACCFFEARLARTCDAMRCERRRGQSADGCARAAMRTGAGARALACALARTLSRTGGVREAAASFMSLTWLVSIVCILSS
jgi:hypothetical protein